MIRKRVGVLGQVTVNATLIASKQDSGSLLVPAMVIIQKERSYTKIRLVMMLSALVRINLISKNKYNRKFYCYTHTADFAFIEQSFRLS